MRRRSFIYRKLEALGAQFAECNDAAVAGSFSGAAAEVAAASKLGLADLSPLRRVGFKGAGAADWLAGQGLAVPAINRALRQSDGALVVRMGANDIMIVSDLNQRMQTPQRLLQAWSDAGVPPREPRGFPMLRQEGFCWFALTGMRAAETMAKLCGVDMRPVKFADGEVAQTSVARLSAVVVRNDLRDVLAYHLYADSASAEYWWECLLDAAREFDGKPVGLDALRSLADHPANVTG